MLFDVRWGDPAAGPAVTFRPRMRVFPPLRESTDDDQALPQLETPQLALRLLAEKDQRVLWTECSGRRAIQLSWSKLDGAPTAAGTAAQPTQVLPAMKLVHERCSGFAVLQWRCIPDQPSWPLFETEIGFVEALLQTAWGDSLFAHIDGAADPARLSAATFSGSAGDVGFGYTLRFDPSRPDAPWQKRLLANGVIELHNLTSWPLHRTDAETPDRFPVSVPAARPAGGKQPPLSHRRHAVRVLLNQHELPAPLLVAGGAAMLFGLAGPRHGAVPDPADSAWTTWQFLAITEHLLVDVEVAAEAGPLPDGSKPVLPRVAELVARRRWTVLQELRLCTPRDFGRFLALGELTTPNFHGRDMAAIAQTARGYFAGKQTLLDGGSSSGRRRLRPVLLEALAAQSEEVLLIEASAPIWLRPRPVSAPLSNLQYLMRGIQQGALSTPEDFLPSTGTDSWLLLAVPFLGRLVPAGPPPPLTAPSAVLSVDPVVILHSVRNARQQGHPVPLPLLACWLASWADERPLLARMSEFDRSGYRRFRSLPSTVLLEMWSRVQKPPEEPRSREVQTVLAALPADSPGRLGRPAAMRALFAWRREALPPVRSTAAEVVEEAAQALQWRPGGLFVIESGVENASTLTGDVKEDLCERFAFAVIGAQFDDALGKAELPRGSRSACYPAVTLIPTPLHEPPGAAAAAKKEAITQPLSFVVSPFVALGFTSLEPVQEAKPEVTVGELLCANPGIRQLQLTSSRLWSSEEAATADEIDGWLAQMHAVLAPDSPIAVLRERRVFAAQPPTGQPRPQNATSFVCVEYRFRVAPGAEARTIAQPLQPLRADPSLLWFTEGSYGGTHIPPPLHGWELAPPLTRRVQGLYVRGDEPQDDGAPKARIGYSGLRVDVLFTDGAIGMTAPLPAGPPAAESLARLWWFAAQHSVQYALPTDFADGDPNRQRKLLPDGYAARVIKGLRPALPGIPLPDRQAINKTLAGGGGTSDPDLSQWQAVLPGSLRYVLVGARPGAPLVIRNQLQTQLFGSSCEQVASGSIPVQHRAPRPPPLPPNELAERALQPWRHRGAAGVNCLVASAPAGTALIESADGVLSQLHVCLGSAEIDLRGPSPVLQIFYKQEGTAPQAGGSEKNVWRLRAQLRDETTKVELRELKPSIDGSLVADQLALDKEAALPDLFAGKPHGALLICEMQACFESQGELASYWQTLRFPLRIRRVGPPLPLSPTFVRFEDPEYNRLLSSQPMRSTVAREIKKEPWQVVLAMDRRRYNAGGLAYLLADVKPPKDTGLKLAMTLVMRRVTPGGVQADLQSQTWTIDAVQKAPRLLPIDLAKEGKALQPGDLLKLTLSYRIEGGPAASQPEELVSVSVDIDREDVAPPPSAAYALLRGRSSRPEPEVTDVTTAQCVRFAWSPRPAEIVLSNPEDLRGDIVRRRAVFSYCDVALDSEAQGAVYAVQKVTSLGSTHFPSFRRPEPPPG